MLLVCIFSTKTMKIMKIHLCRKKTRYTFFIALVPESVYCSSTLCFKRIIIQPQTDRQTDRHTDRQADRQSYRQTIKDRHKQTQTATIRHRQSNADTAINRHRYVPLSLNINISLAFQRHALMHTHTLTHTRAGTIY